jgi:protein-tyrosine phosphatase
MIDIHSHVIFGVDDGANNVQDSLDMLEMAAASGTTDIVATPHENSEFSYERDVIEKRLDDLKTRIGAKIRLHLGCDLHLSCKNVESALADTEKYSINGMGYLLVEFSDISIPPNTKLMFSQMLNRGLVPIITHPERNNHLQKRITDLAQWVDLGCSVQITAQSLLGTFGGDAKRFSMDLLRRGLVQFVASDAHDTKYRPPRLDTAFAFVRKEFDLDLARLVFVENPLRVLTGEPVEFSQFTHHKHEGRRWFNFFLAGRAVF